VRDDLIDIVEHGATVGPLPGGARKGIVFYAGHHFNAAKGLDNLTKALGLVKARRGEAPELRVHGHYGDKVPEFALQLVKENGLEGLVTWLNQIGVDETVAEYRKAAICALPYRGSFAGFSAATAMANGAAVICTRRAGLPDHVGDAAVFVGEQDVEGLAVAIERLLCDTAFREQLVAAAHGRATRMLTWDAIAEKTVKVYGEAVAHRAGHRSGEARANHQSFTAKVE